MDNKPFNDLITSVTQAGIIKRGDEDKPRIVFEGGPNDGRIWPMYPLEHAIKIDRWDDNTINSSIASSLVPMENFRFLTITVGDKGKAETESECVYTYSHKIKGTEDYVYRALIET